MTAFAVLSYKNIGKLTKNKYIRLIKAHFLSIIDACWQQAILSARSFVYHYLTL